MTKLQLKETVSKPTDKAFYNQFFTASNVTSFIGYFGQLVSALTEFHLFFSSCGGAYQPFWTTSNILPVLAGLAAIILFEVLGVRIYLVRIIRQIVNKDFGSWERVVLFCFNMLFVLALCGANLVSSWLGQTMTFAAKTNVVVTDKTQPIEDKKTAKLDKITARYNKQLEQLKKTYQTDKTDMTKRFDTDIKQLEKSQNKFKDVTWKYNQYTLKIDNKLVSKQTDLSDLKTTFDSDKNDLKGTYDYNYSLNEKSFDNRINDISKSENSNISLWATVQKYTLPVLIAFILLSWFAIIYKEIFYKGAGQNIEVKEVEKRPLLIIEILTGIYDRIYQLFYYLTARFVGSKKYQFGAIKQDIKVYNINDVLSKKEAVNRPNVAAQNVRQIGFNRNNENQANNNQNNPINNQNNPLINSQSNQLINNGLNQTNVSPGSLPNVQRYTVNVKATENNQNNDKIRGCNHCNVMYSYKHWNSKYCSEKCRIKSWENRTGKTFKKKSKKN